MVYYVEFYMAYTKTMSWVHELRLWAKTQISKLIFLHYIDFFYRDIIENNLLSQFNQNRIIYFVNDLFTDKPSKLFSFQNHYFNDIHVFVSFFLMSTCKMDCYFSFWLNLPICIHVSMFEKSNIM